MNTPEIGKMHILYLSGSRFPTEKAYGYQIVKECESLAGLGLDVTLIFPELAPRQARNMGVPRQPDLMMYYSVKRNFRLKTEAIAPFLDPLYSDMSSVWFLLKILTFAFRSRELVRKNCRKGRAVIWTQDLFVVLAQLLGGKAQEDILAFECHDVAKKPLAFFAPVIRRLKKIVVTTSGLKKEFLNIGFPEDRILVLPNAVAVNEFSISESQETCRRLMDLPLDRPIIGYIGKFHTYGLEKGIPTLIRSLVYLKEKYSHPPLIVCVGGPMEYAEIYYRVADDAGVPREMIQFVDFQPRLQIPRWMKACDVCTIPSPAKRFFMKSASPMKLFEYLAAGVPVVASDLPAIRDILQDGKNGLLVPPEDPRAWAAAIARILDDRNFAGDLARRGFETVKDNSWERRAARAFSFMVDDPEQWKASFPKTDA
jgi:glycosyltransferase involved in cell wall biosynthesis